MTNPWPAIPYAAWKDTKETLHLMTQIVGKVRLAQTPWLNHSWQVPLYVSARGLTTGPFPHDSRLLEIEFDLVERRLEIRCSDGGRTGFALGPMPISSFYALVMSSMQALGAPVHIHAAPNELPDAVPFAQDTAERAWDGDAVRRFWQALVQCQRVFGLFRTEFLGKASPVHLFWGALDLAVTRFSGRRAPLHPGGVPNLPLAVAREAYSHEVSSAGFWPGGFGAEEAAFYSYAYPEPPGFRDAKVEPAAARFDAGLGEFILPYEAVRTAADPDAVLLAFLRSTYAAAADNAAWDRADLECAAGRPGVPRPV